MDFVVQMWRFLGARRKFWLLPIIVVTRGARRAAGAGAGLGGRAVHLHAVLEPTMRILGISAYYHDSAAALLVDGRVVAAAQEERFTRKKHDAGFPHHAIRSCLRARRHARRASIDHVAFYDKPFLKFERLLETYLAFAPRGFASFRQALPVWVKDKLFQRSTHRSRSCRRSTARVDWEAKLLFSEHHLSHAASAFYPSPFERAAVLTMDGVGEWTTTSLALGNGRDLKVMREIHFPHSLGLLYSAFTYYTGFKVNSGEYKVMGLAPYGEPRYAELIRDHLIDIKDDGSFRLNLDYFDYCTGLTMTNEQLRRAVRRAAAQARGAPDAARDGPRGVDPGGHRGGRAQARARHRARRPARRTCASPAAWRSTAWPTASCCARSTSTGCGCSRPRATPAARSARRCVGLPPLQGQATQPSRTGPRRHAAAATSGPEFSQRRDRAAGCTGPARSSRRLDDEQLIERCAARPRRGQGARLVPGPHGVRPARARRALDPGRRALADDAEDAQPQGQVPRVVPAVRALGAARGRRRSGSTSTARARTCCWCADVARGAPHRDDRGAERSCSASTSSTCRARRSPR